jgi:hypothetical protein
MNPPKDTGLFRKPGRLPHTPAIFCHGTFGFPTTKLRSFRKTARTLKFPNSFLFNRKIYYCQLSLFQNPVGFGQAPGKTGGDLTRALENFTGVINAQDADSRIRASAFNNRGDVYFYVTIVPDGTLSMLPFDILKRKGNTEYFGEEYRLSLSRYEISRREKEAGRETSLLAFGGAWYSSEKPAAERRNDQGSGFAAVQNTSGTDIGFKSKGFSLKNRGTCEITNRVIEQVH